MAGNVLFRYFGSALCNTNDRARISQLILSCLIECWFRGHSYRITLHKDSWNKAIFYAWEMCLLYISGLDAFFLLVHKPHIKLPWVLASCWVKATKCERVIRSRENRGICDVGVKRLHHHNHDQLQSASSVQPLYSGIQPEEEQILSSCLHITRWDYSYTRAEPRTIHDLSQSRRLRVDWHFLSWNNELFFAFF